ncbi:conserved protein of unknown function [Candidatus Nitrosocosmicus franklandus]|uniref:Uncharacterized protein n=2 Tax=Candidatus Nitrosocosmicus franklandianus TaxID=1798806 RepID=A0A484IBY7_9ARCH|nr:conserved protein of unknown function [Candidatus Nitrosocosmicus franklandus]
MRIRRLKNSIKFYLPRIEGYLEVLNSLLVEFEGMSLIEFDGYFEKKVEPAKYVRAEVHIDKMNERKIIKQANQIRKRLDQKSLAIEINGQLVLIEHK